MGDDNERRVLDDRADYVHIAQRIYCAHKAASNIYCVFPDARAKPTSLMKCACEWFMAAVKGRAAMF